MRLKNCFKIIGKNRCVVLDNKEENRIYFIHNGKPRLQLIRKGDFELTEIRTNDGVLVFKVNEDFLSSEDEVIIKPLLSEILVLVKSIKVVRVLVNGRAIDKISVDCLDRGVANIYTNDYNVLFIELE